MGKVVHFEIHATNPGKTVDFFTRVFGRKFKLIEDSYYYIDFAIETWQLY